MATNTATRRHRRRGRAIATGAVCLALAGGAVVAIAVRKPKAGSAIETPSIFKTATVSLGDLTTTERVDGTVQLSSTLPVLHRIEGQTSSSTTPSASETTQTPEPTSNPTGPAALSSPLLLADCATTTVPTTNATTTTTTVAAPDNTTPDTTPAATTSTTIAETTTTVAVAVEPCPTSTTTTIPNTPTIPSNPTVPTTTTPAVITDTVPAESAPTGGNRVGAGPTGSTGSTGADATSSATRITQTITSIIGVNAVTHQGDVLYTVDGSPVVALDGALPAWRSLSTSSDDGADIAQLEASLVALGYDPDQSVTVDNVFDSATKSMVEAWQQGLGLEATGEVALGSVVFLPSSTTVNSVDQSVGDTVGDGDTVLTLATPTQDVLVDVPAGDEAQVVPGLAVEIGNVQGTVSRLRSADRDGAVVVQAVITPASAIENATNGSAVKVTLTLQNDAGVLLAPAEALVSRLDGTYAVQQQTSDGTTKWITVELIGVSGSNVAIRGTDLSEGTVLLLPA